MRSSLLTSLIAVSTLARNKVTKSVVKATVEEQLGTKSQRALSKQLSRNNSEQSHKERCQSNCRGTTRNKVTKSVVKATVEEQLGTKSQRALSKQLSRNNSEQSHKERCQSNCRGTTRQQDNPSSYERAQLHLPGPALHLSWAPRKVMMMMMS